MKDNVWYVTEAEYRAIKNSYGVDDRGIVQSGVFRGTLLIINDKNEGDNK